MPFNYIVDILPIIGSADSMKCIEWLQNIRLLARIMICDTCTGKMVMRGLVSIAIVIYESFLTFLFVTIASFQSQNYH